MYRALLALAAFLALLPSPLRAEDPSVLRGRLDEALRVRSLRGARVAALVVDLERGHELYAKSPDRAMVPASNLKLLTALAALRAFGPTHRFETHLLADAPLDADGAIGTLYVRGGGDPSLTSEDFWRLAGDLRRLGLRSVGGGLVLDDSAFDSQRWHPSWGRVSARAYHAPVGALTVNYGAYAVVVEPGPEEGTPVRARLDPPIGFLQLANRARTGSARAPRTLRVDRAFGSSFEQVVLSGVVPARIASKTYQRSVLDPASYAGAVLRMQLEANGIAVSGEPRAGQIPADAVPLLEFAGHPVSEVVRLLLKYSNNSIAEALLKAIGARATGGTGSWMSGVSAVRADLAAAGLGVEFLQLVDGSGLSYENRVTPRLLVDALRLAVDSFSFGPEYLAALPIAAGDGTLEERAEGAAGRVRAKTGLLTRVTGLSGVARLSDGSVAAFSVLVNGFRGNTDAALDGVDGFVTALVGPSEDQERVAVSP